MWKDPPFFYIHKLFCEVLLNFLNYFSSEPNLNHHEYHCNTNHCFLSPRENENIDYTSEQLTNMFPKSMSVTVKTDKK